MDKTTKEIIGGMLPNQRKVVVDLAFKLVDTLEGNNPDKDKYLDEGIDTINFISSLQL